MKITVQIQVEIEVSAANRAEVFRAVRERLEVMTREIAGKQELTQGLPVGETYYEGRLR